MHEWFSQFNHKDSLGSHGSGVVLMTLTLESIVVHHTLEPLIAYGLWLLTISGTHSGGMADGCFPSLALGSMVLSFDCQSAGPYCTFMGSSSQRFFNDSLGINVHHPLLRLRSLNQGTENKVIALQSVLFIKMTAMSILSDARPGILLLFSYHFTIVWAEGRRSGAHLYFSLSLHCCSLPCFLYWELHSATSEIQNIFHLLFY